MNHHINQRLSEDEEFSVRPLTNDAFTFEKSASSVRGPALSNLEQILDLKLILNLNLNLKQMFSIKICTVNPSFNSFLSTTIFFMSEGRKVNERVYWS